MESEIEDGVDDDAPKRVKTTTKVALVAVGWVLLTLFLIGQFSGGRDAPDRARLDTVAGAGADLDDDGDFDEYVEEDAYDVNGDGIIEVGEGVREGVATASGGPPRGGGSGAASGEDGAGASTGPAAPSEAGAGAAGGATGGTAGGAAGEAGSGGATATTTRSGTATTSTTAAGGSSGTGTGSTTSTTASPSDGGGSSSPSSTAPAPTSTSPIILIVKARNNAYQYPNGYGADFALASGSQIRFDNDEGNSGVKHSFTIPTFWDSGEIKAGDGTRTSPPIPPGAYTYTCTRHPATMRGTITVS